MDDGYDRDKSSVDNEDDGAFYTNCIRLVEGGHIRRFEYVAAKFDIVQYELNDRTNKPLIFYAIEHNDEVFVKILLDMEIPLNKKYSVRIYIFFSVYLVNNC